MGDHVRETVARHAAGADLVRGSPIADAALPDVDGLSIGRGAPELHARALADNARRRDAGRRFAGADRLVYADCGGFLYLADFPEDADGVAHPMVRVLPLGAGRRTGRLTLADGGVERTADTPLAGPGAVARGHEFDGSALDPVPAAIPRGDRLWQRRGASARTRRAIWSGGRS